MSDALADFFTRDHRECDEEWAKVERAARGGQHLEPWRRFDARLRRHLAMEEEVLFPAFEAASGMRGFGPTVVMRAEHERMRALLEEIGGALERGETDEALDQGDTLLMLIQQHNMKEEGMLYPMAEQTLGADWAALRARLASYEAARGARSLPG